MGTFAGVKIRLQLKADSLERQQGCLVPASQLPSFLHISCRRAVGNTVEEGRTKVGEAEGEEERWEMSPGHGMTAVLMNSKELYKLGLVNIPLQGRMGLPETPPLPEELLAAAGCWRREESFSPVV